MLNLGRDRSEADNPRPLEQRVSARLRQRDLIK